MADRLDRLSAKHIVIVEGDSDCAFVRALVCKRGLNDFQVIAPSEVSQNAGGRSGFTRILNYLPILPGFDKVDAILLISDNDDSPDSSFSEVVEAIQRAEAFGEPLRKYPVPSQSRKKASGANPTIIVYMVPGSGLPGNLETWCLEAAKQAHGRLIGCVEGLADCADINGWSVTQRAKAGTRSFIAVANQQRPDLSLTKVWEKAPHLFPIDSSAFDDLAEFLRDFPRLIAP